MQLYYMIYVVLEKTVGGPLDCKEIKPVNPKEYQSWILIRKTYAEAEAPILGHLMRKTDSLEKTLMLEKIEGRRKGNDRGWDGWMESLTQWTWVWASSRSWWWTRWPGVLQSMGSQRVGHDWVTKQKLLFEYVGPLFNARKLVNFQLCTRDSSLAASNCWFQGPQMGICPIWFWKWDLYPEFRACGSLHASRSVWKQAASGSLKVKIQIDFLKYFKNFNWRIITSQCCWFLP